MSISTDPTVRALLKRVSELESRLAGAENRILALSAPRTAPEVPGVKPETWVYFDTVSATSVDQNELCQNLLIAANGVFNLTLPTPFEGAWLRIYNEGGSPITVKTPSATTICTVGQYQMAYIVAVTNGGLPAWPTQVGVTATTADQYTNRDIVWRTGTYGPVLKSPDNNYWRMTIDNTGALSSTSLGGTEPQEASTPETS